MSQPSAGPVRHYADIQWLRGVAALLVVFEHLKNEMMFRLQGLDPHSSALAFFPFSAGVDIFFVISGFVIAHSSRSLFGRPAARRIFLARRLARIVPLYWLLTAVFLVLLALAGSRLLNDFDLAFVAGSFLFVPVANPDGAPLPILPLGWTLNYEMMFYAIFALVIGLPRRVALLVVVLALLAIAGAGWMMQPSSLPLRVWSNPIILEFAAGIAIQALCARGLAFRGGLRLLLAALGFGALCLVGLPADLEAQRWILWGGPAAVIVLAAASGGGGRPGRWGSLAGDTSYAVYLVHLFVLIALSRLFLAVGATNVWMIYVAYPATALALIAASASILHYGFERPILQRTRRWIDRLPSARAQPH